jgi:hypothetical protein
MRLKIVSLACMCFLLTGPIASADPDPAPQGLVRVVLSTDHTNYRAGDAVVLTTTITNTSGNEIRINWAIGSGGQAFDPIVKNSAGQVFPASDPIGSVHSPRPTELDAGKSLTQSTPLSRLNIDLAPGQYTLKVRWEVTPDPDHNFAVYDAFSNIVAFTVSP